MATKRRGSRGRDTDRRAVEIVTSSFKRILGEAPYSIKKENQVQEAKLRTFVCNRLVDAGMMWRWAAAAASRRHRATVATDARGIWQKLWDRLGTAAMLNSIMTIMLVMRNVEFTTALFALLVATAILSFSGINMATAEESAYIRLAQQQKSIEDMPEKEREQYVQAIKDTMTRSPYDRAVYGMLENLSQIKEQVQRAEEKGEDVTDLMKRAWAIIYDLEEYGVVSEDRLLENPEYWSEKGQTARERLGNNDTVTTPASAYHAQLGGGTVEDSEIQPRIALDCPVYHMKYNDETQRCEIWWDSAYVAIPIMAAVIITAAYAVVVLARRRNRRKRMGD